MRLPFHHRLLLRLQAFQVPDAGADDIFAALYAPGLICSRCGEDMMYGYFIKNGLIVGRVCAEGWGDPAPWGNALKCARVYRDWRHYEAERELPRGDRKILKNLALLVQLYPHNFFARGMFKLLLAGSSLSVLQRQKTLEMLSEHAPWEELLQIRDWVYRLGLFSLSVAAGLGDQCNHGPCWIEQNDWEMLESLANLVLKNGLTYRQDMLLYALEGKYAGLRAVYVDMLAEAFKSSLSSQ
jgi:hypothetical protein